MVAVETVRAASLRKMQLIGSHISGRAVHVSGFVTVTAMLLGVDTSTVLHGTLVERCDTRNKECLLLRQCLETVSKSA